MMKCQYLGCDEEATIRIVRANIKVCDKHLLTNMDKFGCRLTVERLKEKAK